MDDLGIRKKAHLVTAEDTRDTRRCSHTQISDCLLERSNRGLF